MQLNQAFLATLVAMQMLSHSCAHTADGDTEGMTPLVAACHSEQLGLVQELLNHGAQPNLAAAEGETPLMSAAEEGNVAIVSALMFTGADVDALSSDHQTALMLAAQEGHLESVQTRLASGADASQCGEEGTSLLMAAISRLTAMGYTAMSYLDIMVTLVAAGAYRM